MLAELAAHAESAGLNLFGVVDTEQFDKSQPTEARCERLVPGCGTAVVLGSGGNALWQLFVAARRTPRLPSYFHSPVQRFVVSAVQPVQAHLRQLGLQARCVSATRRIRLNLAALAEAAGLGTVSPVIGALLHPRFGPWVSIRAVLLLPGRPFGAVPDRSLGASFQPCCECSRPCVSACPVHVHDGEGATDVGRCVDHRLAGGCQTGCNVRRACPVGATERYGPDEELHRHAEETLLLAQRHGLGVLRLLRAFLRR